MKQGFVTLLAIFGFVLAATVHAGTGPVDPAAKTEFEFAQGVDGRWDGINSAHQLQMSASPAGLQFTLEPRSADGQPRRVRFHLEGWGRGSTLSVGLASAPEVFATGEELQIDHGAVVEWYKNGPRGVEHGFTIHSRPESEEHGPLRLSVGIESDLVPDLSEDGRALTFRTPQGEIALHYNKLAVMDSTERDLDARMEFAGTELQFVIDDERAVYPVTVDPLLSTIAWEMTDDRQQRFGQRVGTFGDMDGDGMSDLYVFDDGGIYWWSGSTSGPIEKTNFNENFGNFTEIGDVDDDGIDDMVKCSGNGSFTMHLGDGAGDFTLGTSFNAGFTVGSFCGPAGDINGDGNPDLWAVGPVPLSIPERFSTWIFHGNGVGGFNTTPVTELPASTRRETWGDLVLLSDFSAGDVNGDGYDDFLAGTNLGMQLYLGGASGLSTTAHWSVTGVGQSVAIAGDLNCDQYPDIVGTHVDSGIGGADVAELIIYRGHPSSVSTVPLTTITGFQGTDNHGGLQVAAAGDVNGDGCADLLVGEAEYTHFTSDYLRGRALVYYGSTTLYTASTDADADWSYSTTSVYLDDEELGFSVSAAGDVNFDGYGDIVIGAPGHDNVAYGDGRVLLFYGSAETLEPATSRTWRSSLASNALGTSVDLLGDLNGDGFSDIVVGVPGFNGAGGTGSGRAYLYYGGAGTPNIGVDFWWEGDDAYDNLGQAVAGAGDVNGDGYEDVIIGAPNADNGTTTYVGKAYLYLGGPSFPSGTPAATITGSASGDALGWSVSSAGDIDRDGFGDVIVGAPFQAYRGIDGAGCAYVYYGTATGLHPTRKATFCGVQEWASYGWSVASGDFNRDGFSDVAIGEPFSTYNGLAYSGHVDVYLGRATGISTSPVRSLSGVVANHYYGVSMSGAGDVNGDGYSDLVIGGYGYSNGQTDEGSAEIRYGHATLGVNSYTRIEGNATGASFGQSVDSAGDVNGDGRGDIIVGAPGIGAGGTAYVYHGASGGISTTAAWSAAGVQAGEYFGNAVSSAGDMDGDGYGDVVVGSPNYDYSTSSNSGQVSFFAGGGDRAVFGNAVRQMIEDTASPVARGRRSDTTDSFAIDMRNYHPAGKIHVVLEHQVRRQTEWYGTDVVDGALYPLLSDSTRVTGWAWDLDEQEIYKWRVRMKGDLPAFKYGRWFTLPGRGLQEASLQTDGCHDVDHDGYGYPGGPSCSGGPTLDNCPTSTNPTQLDTDGDGAGDVCDADDDNDKVLDVNDNCPLDINPDQADFDGDGIGDVCDPSSDLDADGILDGADNCMTVANADQADADLDGFGDVCDNCPQSFQTAQSDLDADGFGAECDCSDANANVWDLPGAIDTVTVGFSAATGETTVLWGDPVVLGGTDPDSSGLGFDVLASGDPGDFLTQSVCVATELSHDTHAVSFADSGLPPAVTLEYFLVRAQHACGEGSVGTTHEGLERPAASCP